MRIYTITLLLAASLASTVAASTPAREIPIHEEPTTPGVASNYYPLCSTLHNSVFMMATGILFGTCEKKAPYNWEGDSLPTTVERQQLCSCATLMGMIQRVPVPRCSLYKDGQLRSYAQVIQYAFGLCTLGSSSWTTGADVADIVFDAVTSTSNQDSTGTTTGTDADSKAKKTSSSSPSSSSSSSSSSPSSKIPLIGGITGGVVGAAAGGYGAKKWKDKKEKKDGDDDDSSDDGDDDRDIEAAVSEPPSPLASSTRSSTHYTASAISPKA